MRAGPGLSGHDALVTDVQRSQRRELLEGEASEIFREVVKTGVLPHDDARLSEDHDSYPSVAVLLDLGLLRKDDDAGGWVAVDPASVQPSVVAPLGRQVVELLDESSAWADLFGGLGQAYRRRPSDSTPLTELRGLASINRFIESAVDDAEHELLTAQPAGPRRAQALEISFDRDRRALDRGVQMRTLYQHTARRGRAMQEYVEMMREHGAQVRTLDEFFKRLIIIDRRVALIPGSGSETAMVIVDRAMIDYLADVFERSWERARDYEGKSRTSESEIATEIRQLTLRMLAEGHSDSASAKRVGVSTRTYATYVATLKSEFNVATRFQLGYALGVADTEANGTGDSD